MTDQQTPAPLTAEEEAIYREALVTAPTYPAAGSAVEALTAMWADRCRRLLATLDAARALDVEALAEAIRKYREHVAIFADTDALGMQRGYAEEDLGRAVAALIESGALSNLESTDIPASPSRALDVERLTAILDRHDSGGGVARWGGDALLADLRAALAASPSRAERLEAENAALRNDLLVAMNWLLKLAYPGSIKDFVQRFAAPNSTIPAEYETLRETWFGDTADAVSPSRAETILCSRCGAGFVLRNGAVECMECDAR